MATNKCLFLNGEKISFDDAVKKMDAQKFIALRHGLTHFELDGPQDGTPVVLVNGFSIPLFLWDHTYSVLAEAGFRVLRFDFYGRGFSARPDVEYGPDLFDQQLLDILEALKIKDPIHLIGSSMGGVVSAIFADRHPEQVNKLVLIDPAGMMAPMTFPMSALKVPLVGEVIMHLLGDIILLPSMKDDLLHPDAFPEYLTLYEPQMRIFGFKRAILSTLRSGMLYNEEAVYRRLGQKNIPILLLWGKEDRVIPLPIGERCHSVLPHANFQIIDQAGHVPHYELSERINPILTDFLKSPA